MRLRVEEIQRDPKIRTYEFPVCGSWIYWAHAGVSPLPRRVSEAVQQFAARGSLDNPEAVFHEADIARLRGRIGQLVQAEASEIALIGPTSAALSLVARGLRWRQGDNVVVWGDDFPSNVYPWLALHRLGVEVRLAYGKNYGVIQPEEILQHIDSRTRLVAISSIHYLTGWRPDLTAIKEETAHRGAMLCVDAIQSIGIWPVELELADVIACGAHKWMLGPTGAGFLCVRSHCLELFEPVLIGWHNALCPDFIPLETLKFRKDAGRFESGTAPLFDLVGLRAAVDLLLEVGLQNIWDEAKRKRVAWTERLLQAGCTVLGGDFPAERSGPMITFRVPDVDSRRLYAKLLQNRIVSSLRKDRSGTQWIRISPHFYNTDQELDRLIEVLRER